MNNPDILFFSLKMVADDEIRLSADAYWAKLVYNQTLLDKLWTTIKIASVGLALVSSDVTLIFWPKKICNLLFSLKVEILEMFHFFEN